MSRVERLNKLKKIKRTIIYPSLIFLGFMVLFLLLVDYRVNDSLGMKNIQIVNIKKQSDSKTQVGMLGNKGFVVDTSYVKKDYKRLKNYVSIMTRELKNSIPAFKWEY